MGEHNRSISPENVQYSSNDASSPTGYPEAVESALVAFVRERVEAANAAGVVAMSGGLDSTVTAALAVEALGSDRVLDLALPCHKTDASAAMEAGAIAAAAEGLDLDPETAERLVGVYRQTAHKRAVPPTPGLDGRPRQPSPSSRK